MVQQTRVPLPSGDGTPGSPLLMYVREQPQASKVSVSSAVNVTTDLMLPNDPI